MTKLDPKDGHTVLINTFTVHPEKADAVVQVLVDATETMHRMPGFVSTNLHVSHDRKRVVNYVQWRSEEDFEAMLGNEEAQPHMRAAADLAEGYEPVLYSLEFTGS